MSKAVLFLADGMADEALPELGGRTPLQAVDTPWMDRIAAEGASGTFLTLPEGYPTSSDVANMSVLGYDVSSCFPGRGPLEAASMGVELSEEDIAMRINFVTVEGGVLKDYSAGHVAQEKSIALIKALQSEFGSEKVSFHAGVSYRNLLVLHGSEFSEKFLYHKPDSSQGELIMDLRLRPADESAEARCTVDFLEDLADKSGVFLAEHPLNADSKSPANRIWPWSPGGKPELPSFSDKYAGRRAAVISAVDVIFGIAKCAQMECIRIPGATGFIDTDFEAKAEAAVKALQNHDFVYLHVEAIDECSHMGDLELKMQAIAHFENRIVAPVMQALSGMDDVSFAVLPDHPVPVKKRKHTRTPVPVAICGPHIRFDRVMHYSEPEAAEGGLGRMKGDMLMKKILDLEDGA